VSLLSDAPPQPAALMDGRVRCGLEHGAAVLPSSVERYARNLRAAPSQVWTNAELIRTRLFARHCTHVEGMGRESWNNAHLERLPDLAEDHALRGFCG